MNDITKDSYSKAMIYSLSREYEYVELNRSTGCCVAHFDREKYLAIFLEKNISDKMPVMKQLV